MSLKHEIDLKKFEIRTDLITESVAFIDSIKKDIVKYDDITVEKIVLDKKSSLEFNKKPGKYITISFDDVTDVDNRSRVEKVLFDTLSSLFKEVKLNTSSRVLVIGLGNDKSTADSLGPLVIDNVLITRHLFVLGMEVEKGYSNVSGFKPGVMGSTGIETFDIIKGLIEEINPDFIIAVDALAASSIDRLNKTIQICDSGINPGSGIGNQRKELSYETLGIPVLAIGVPTVVDFLTIVDNTFSYLLKKLSYSKNNISKMSEKLRVSSLIDYSSHTDSLSDEEKIALLGSVGSLTDIERRSLLFEVLAPLNYNLMVTPKEIDFVMEKLAFVISSALNKTLHSKYNEKT